MPYFKWKGVTLIGEIKKGKSAASSPIDLSNRLLQQGISMIASKQIYLYSFLWPINEKIKGDIFQQQADLLKTGILLPQVLEIIGQQFYNPRICQALFIMSEDIKKGLSFDLALEKQSFLNDPIVSIMLKAGCESDNIIPAIDAVTLYFYKLHSFKKNIRSILMMPLLTFFFFIGITLFIFIVIIPRFADIFQSLQCELPLLTQYIFYLSQFMSGFSLVYCLITIAFFSYIVYRIVPKKGWLFLLLRLPFIGKILLNHHIYRALQAISLLLCNGITLPESLKIVSQSLSYPLQPYFMDLYQEVASGQSLARILHTHSIFLPEVVTLLCMGEEMGTLAGAFKNAASLYNDRLEEALQKFIFLLQPIVIILLGLLITTLIIAVYLPIMQLSHII